MKPTIREALYLAGLLHDIGKFGQRANKSTGGLSQQTLGIQGDICPNYKGNFSHWHVLWTSEYFEQFKQILPQSYEWEGRQEQIGTLSARHHMTGNLMLPERIIAFADKLSSAQDRRPEEEEAMLARAASSENKFREAKLQSIYDFVNRTERQNKAFYALQPLSLKRDAFPKRGNQYDTAQVNAYGNLWKAFLEDSKRLPKDDFGALSTTLLALLRKYTWAIPSSTMDQLDISLYDHLKTTAALSVSLYDSIAEHGPLPGDYIALRHASDGQKRFRLMAIDLSGIQAFIYQISRKSAAKTLKGRSFYLQLLMDTVIDQILQLYDLQKGHVLMNSGGKAHILMANRTDKQAEETALFNRINYQLNQFFNGKLYLNTASVTFSAGKLAEAHGYSEILTSLASRLDTAKKRKFSSIIQVHASDFFAPQDLRGLTSDDVCKVTGTDLYAEADEDEIPFEKRKFIQRSRRKIDDSEGEATVSRMAAMQIALGEDLRNARWIVTYRNAALSPKNAFAPLLDEDELFTSLRFVICEKPTPELLKGALCVEAINDCDGFLDFSAHTVTYGSAFRFYGAASMPRNSKENRIREFSEIAKDNKVDALGILRMDVDGLGKAFSQGFLHKEDDAVSSINMTSISRISTLSSSLDWFFNGYMDTIIRSFSPDFELINEVSEVGVAGHIYPVYAGGDDLFFVTRWDLAPHLGRYIRDEFKAFTNQHPQISISGGVAVVDDKTPIHSAAVEAERMEAMSKNIGDGGKDAFTFFEYTLGWDDYAYFENYLRFLKKIAAEAESKAFLGLLRNVAFEYNPKNSPKITDKNMWGSWRWRMAYRVKRMIGSNSRLEEPLAAFTASLFTGTYSSKEIHSTHSKQPNQVEGEGFTRLGNDYREIGLVDSIPLATRWLHNLTRTTKGE
jgi:CRISPR-associated protein Csm1